MTENAQAATPAMAPDFAAIAFRRRYWLGGGLLAGWLAAALLLWLVPAQYLSSCVLELGPLRNLATPALAPASPPMAHLQDVMQWLDSGPALTQLAVRLHARLGPAAPTAAQLRQRLLLTPVLPDPSLHAPSHDALLEIDYRAPGRQAGETNAAIAQIWVEKLQTRQQRRWGQTAEFLNHARAEANASWLRRQGAVRQFEARYLGELPAQLPVLEARLQAASAAAAQARAARSQAAQQAIYLRTLLARYQRLSRQLALPAGAAVQIAALNQQLDQREAELARLRSEETAANPDVVQLEKEIAADRRLRRQWRQTPPASGTPPAAQPLPVTTEIMQLASQQQANHLAWAHAQISLAHWQQATLRLRQQLAAMPLRQQQLAELQAREQSAQQRYAGLATAAQQAEMTARLAHSQPRQIAQILSPATHPSQPVSPDRQQWNWMGILAGLATGIGLAAWMEARDSRLWDMGQLPATRPEQIWGLIPELATAAERRQNQRRRQFDYAALYLLICGLSLGSWWICR